jgi:hypothetical protein
MQLIEVDEVLAAVTRQLAGEPARHRLPVVDVAYTDAGGTVLGVIVRSSVEVGRAAVTAPADPAPALPAAAAKPR